MYMDCHVTSVFGTPTTCDATAEAEVCIFGKRNLAWNLLFKVAFNCPSKIAHEKAIENETNDL